MIPVHAVWKRNKPTDLTESSILMFSQLVCDSGSEGICIHSGLIKYHRESEELGPPAAHLRNMWVAGSIKWASSLNPQWSTTLPVFIYPFQAAFCRAIVKLFIEIIMLHEIHQQKLMLHEIHQQVIAGTSQALRLHLSVVHHGFKLPFKITILFVSDLVPANIVTRLSMLSLKHLRKVETWLHT